jgi:hypothetical protein
LVDFELARLDVWHYNDDYLQPTQLNRLQRDLQENFWLFIMSKQVRSNSLVQKKYQRFTKLMKAMEK